MKILEELNKPTKEEQKVAMESYDTLNAALGKIHSDYLEIEIEETAKPIKIPVRILKLFVKILEETSKGKPVSIVPIATEVTTQVAAEMLGCSRPHLIKLLDQGEIRHTKVGRHRRIKYEDVVLYKKR